MEFKLNKNHIVAFIVLLIVPGGSLVLIGIMLHKLLKFKKLLNK